MADVNWRRVRVADCELSIRTLNGLRIDHGDDVTLGQIALKTDDELMRSPNIGRKSVREIREAIEVAQASHPDVVEPPIFLPSAMTDWSLLGRAMEFYKAKGFLPVEVPWAVTSRSVDITCPNPKFTARVDGLGSLVGSAEQSFLHLMSDHYLPPIDNKRPGYVACTPCFRLGDVEDGWHFPYFMKIELFVPGNAILDMIHFLNFAGECFRELGATPDMLTTEQTDQGVDILINGHEVGSYGLRAHECEDGRLIQWVYGTGLALPRFSQALDDYNVISVA
jgi:hypothetical protein